MSKFTDASVGFFTESEKSADKPGAEKGLSADYTRQTYIVNKDLNQQLKDYAWLQQRSIKDIVEEMMRGYLADKETISR